MHKSVPSISIFVAFILFASCHNNTADSIEIQETERPAQELIQLTPKQFASSGFETTTLQEMEFTTSLPVAGQIHLPQRFKHSIPTYIGGVVQGMHHIEGHWVKKGQTLFNLTSPELINLQQQYLELTSQMDYLRGEAKRQQLLAEENISAKKLYVKAKADLSQAQATQAGLAKRLELLSIVPSDLTPQDLRTTLAVVSPISGYITNLAIHNGSYLNPSEQAMEISSINGMHLELSILEKDISKLVLDQKVTFSIPSDPNKEYTSDIHLIEKMVNESGMIIVHGEIDSRDMQSLIPGMYVNANVLLKTVSMNALPQEAVVTVDGKSYVLVQLKEDINRYVKTEVEVGQSSDGFVSFTAKENIPAGSTFLAKGSYFLVAGE